MPLALNGTIPACILPFDEDYAIDVPEYRRHLRDLASTPGVTGIVCNGHAGEVTTLSREEWRSSIATAVEEARIDFRIERRSGSDRNVLPRNAGR